jgi:hypothetical protein
VGVCPLCFAPLITATLPLTVHLPFVVVGTGKGITVLLQAVQ